VRPVHEVDADRYQRTAGIGGQEGETTSVVTGRSSFEDLDVA
jgi:hypothetical protein